MYINNEMTQLYLVLKFISVHKHWCILLGDIIMYMKSCVKKVAFSWTCSWMDSCSASRCIANIYSN